MNTQELIEALNSEHGALPFAQKKAATLLEDFLLVKQVEQAKEIEQLWKDRAFLHTELESLRRKLANAHTALSALLEENIEHTLEYDDGDVTLADYISRTLTEIT